MFKEDDGCSIIQVTCFKRTNGDSSVTDPCNLILAPVHIEHLTSKAEGTQASITLVYHHDRMKVSTEHVVPLHNA